MALIGMLEQFNLSSVLQRLETHEKTGLLIIKQAVTWVEFYVRDGRLMCIGPIRTNATLAERLLQDGIISPYVFQEVLQIIGATENDETRIALSLMEAGYVGQETLRSWATGKALEVLQVLLTWSGGEMYFEENVTPTPDRLLVAMSFSSLLSSLLPDQPPATPLTPASPITPSPDVSRAQTLTDPSQFFAAPPSQISQPSFAAPINAPSFSASSLVDISAPLANPSAFASQSMVNFSPLAGSAAFSASSLIDPSSFSPPPLQEAVFESSPTPAAYIGASQLIMDSPLASIGMPDTFSSPPGSSSLEQSSSSSFAQPVPVMAPIQPRYVDTRYMRAEMVLTPADLSAWREQNPPVQLTPDQWRLLTRVDGHTTLQIACLDLAMPRERVCQIAGELVAEGLVHLNGFAAMPMNTGPQPEPVRREASPMPAVYNHYNAPNYAAAPAYPAAPVAPQPPPMMAQHPAPVALPTSDILPQYSSFMSPETESQWGNGGNGATFVPGRGWIASPPPLAPGGSLPSYIGSPYAPIIGRR